MGVQVELLLPPLTFLGCTHILASRRCLPPSRLPNYNLRHSISDLSPHSEPPTDDTLQLIFPGAA